MLRRMGWKVLEGKDSNRVSSMSSANRDKGTIAVDEAKLKDYIRTHRDSPVTIYVQHPILIPAPGDNEDGLKPLMLTTKVRVFYFSFPHPFRCFILLGQVLKRS